MVLRLEEGGGVRVYRCSLILGEGCVFVKELGGGIVWGVGLVGREGLWGS